MRHSPTAKGFTLIEVLISCAILGLAFVAVLGVMSQSLRNIGRVGVHEQVLLHAREQMTELLLPTPLQTGHSSGSWTDGYRWQADVLPDPAFVPAAGAKYGLYRVRLQISWGDEQHPSSYVLETTQWAERPAKPANP